MNSRFLGPGTSSFVCLEFRVVLLGFANYMTPWAARLQAQNTCPLRSEGPQKRSHGALEGEQDEDDHATQARGPEPRAIHLGPLQCGRSSALNPCSRDFGARDDLARSCSIRSSLSSSSNCASMLERLLPALPCAGKDPWAFPSLHSPPPSPNTSLCSRGSSLGPSAAMEGMPALERDGAEASPKLDLLLGRLWPAKRPSV
eukprot:1143229-Pelagomonas_calceolata.AAC.2